MHWVWVAVLVNVLLQLRDSKDLLPPVQPVHNTSKHAEVKVIQFLFPLTILSNSKYGHWSRNVAIVLALGRPHE